jgi:hypothetical protein
MSVIVSGGSTYNVISGQKPAQVEYIRFGLRSAAVREARSTAGARSPLPSTFGADLCEEAIESAARSAKLSICGADSHNCGVDSQSL